MFFFQNKKVHSLFIFHFVCIIRGIIYISIGFNLRGSRTQDTEFKKTQNPLKTIKLSLNKTLLVCKKNYAFILL